MLRKVNLGHAFSVRRRCRSGGRLHGLG